MSAGRHKAYLNRFIHTKKVFFITMIIPAFLGGWRLGALNKKRMGMAILQLMRLTLFTALAQIRNYLLSK